MNKNYKINKIKETIVAPHICISWFKWSWRPRVCIHYYDHRMGEMRYIGIFKHPGNLYPGINGCSGGDRR